MIDPLYPIDITHTRDEIFLIEYDDLLQLQSEMIFYGILGLSDVHNFPTLDEICDVDPIETFEKLAMISMKPFLLELIRDDIENKENYIDDLITRALTVDTWFSRSRLTLMYAINNLVTQNYIKKIVICNKRGFERFELINLFEQFKPYLKKMQFIKANPLELLEEDDSYTTCFMRDTTEFLYALQNPERFHLDKMMMVIRNSFENVSLGIDDDGNIHPIELFNEEFSELTKDKNFQYARITAQRLPEDQIILQGGEI